MKIQDLKDKRILILGFAREGRETLRFLRKNFKNQIIGIADSNKSLDSESKELISKDKKIVLHLGSGYLDKIKDYDLVIKSPGIPPEVIKKFPKKTIITSQTEIFFANCQGIIIGVTATKGKSTTASLIHKIVKDAGLGSYLVGNIGTPALSLMSKIKPGQYCVYELSSHQLRKIKQSPHIAVLLNIFPEHLDYHKTYKDYIDSKAQVTNNQNSNDWLVFNSENIIVKNIAQKSKAKLVDISGIRLEDILDLKKTPFRADFYNDNMKAAVAVGRILKIKDEQIAKSIISFKPLEHRMEYVGKYKGIEFINDSLATNPYSTNAAIKALGDNLGTIILGGYDRGLDYKPLAEQVVLSNLDNIVFFPGTSEKILKECQKAYQKKKKQLPKIFYAKNMQQAVDLCFKNTAAGKTCLLSCASPSFGLFKDYKDRGDQFKKLVKARN